MKRIRGVRNLGALIPIVALLFASSVAAEPQTKDQQRCLNALGSGLAKVATAQQKIALACLKNAAKGRGSAQACLNVSNVKVNAAKRKMEATHAKKCSIPPTLGYTDADTVNEAAEELSMLLLLDLFTDGDSGLDDALVQLADDKDASKCQGAVAKTAYGCQTTRIKQYNRCKKAALKTETLQSSSELVDCLGADPKDGILKACNTRPVTSVIPKKCVAKGVDLKDHFPGCSTQDAGAFAACLDGLVECRVCEALSYADGLGRVCWRSCRVRHFDFYVDAVHGSDGNPGTQSEPFQTITRALSMAPSGARIKVNPGRYDAALGEVFPITLEDGDIIVGDEEDRGDGAAVTEVVGQGAVPGISYPASMVLGDDAVVSGLRFEVATGVLNFGVVLADVTASVRRSTFVTGYGGVHVRGSGASIVVDNRFETNSYGVYAVTVTGTPTVEDNVFNTGALPIDVNTTGEVLIRRNFIAGSGQVGIQVQRGAVRIIDNTFDHATGYRYGAVRAGGTTVLRENTFHVGGLSVRIDRDPAAQPDLGTVASPGNNRFTLPGVAVSLEIDLSVQAVGNTWYNTPPLCGTDIVTSAGTVVWGAAPGESCP